MSFWWGGFLDVWDVWYWLGVVIGVVELYGLYWLLVIFDDGFFIIVKCW